MSVVQRRFTPDRTVFLTCYESGPCVNAVFRAAANDLPEGFQAGGRACVIATSREIARRYFFR